MTADRSVADVVDHIDFMLGMINAHTSAHSEGERDAFHSLLLFIHGYTGGKYGHPAGEDQKAYDARVAVRFDVRMGRRCSACEQVLDAWQPTSKLGNGNELVHDGCAESLVQT